MTITADEAKANLTYLYQTYLPSRPDLLDDAIDGIDLFVELGLPIEDAYPGSMSLFTVEVGRYTDTFPDHPATTADFFNHEAYLESIPSSQIVDFYYPNASMQDRAALIAQLDADAMTVAEFLQGWTLVAQIDATPSAASIIAASESFTYVPEADLSFPGVTGDQLDFLTAVYVGSFNRAPKYEGLKYWAGDLADALQSGVDVGSAFNTVIANMYYAGTENGEMGSDLSNSEYVTYLYENALGRAPEQAGHDYWVEHLDNGTIPRHVFLHTFLVAAMEHSDSPDAIYINARIEVAQFVAQEHVSGIEASPPDLFAVLEGVSDASTARLAIYDLVEEYGPPPSDVPDFNAFWSAEAFRDAPNTEYGFEQTEQFEQIELVGVTSFDGGAEMLIV